MKNKLIRKMLSSPVRTFRTLMFTAALIGVASSSLQGCAMKLSGSVEALDAAMDDSALKHIYESVGETVTTANITTKEGISEAKDAIQGVTDALGRIGDVELEEAVLVRVVDGDTLVVRLSTDEEEKVRLIGINTPESVAPEDYRTANTKEGELASAFVKSMLSDVTTVYLQKDVSNTDKYGRLLRYVWLEEPQDAFDKDEAAEKMLNAMLVLDGIAEAVEYPPDTAYADMFKDFEEEYEYD